VILFLQTIQNRKIYLLLQSKHILNPTACKAVGFFMVQMPVVGGKEIPVE
jgi:hypothetical protein